MSTQLEGQRESPPAFVLAIVGAVCGFIIGVMVSILFRGPDFDSSAARLIQLMTGLVGLVLGGAIGGLAGTRNVPANLEPVVKGSLTGAFTGLFLGLISPGAGMIIATVSGALLGAIVGRFRRAESLRIQELMVLVALVALVFTISVAWLK